MRGFPYPEGSTEDPGQRLTPQELALGPYGRRLHN